MAARSQENYQLYRKYIQQAFRSYQERRDLKMYTELLLTSTTIIIFSVFAIKPTATTIVTLYKEMKTKEQTITKMENKIQSLQKAEKLVDENQEGITLLHEAIPDIPEPEIIIRQIEGASQKNNVSLSNIDVEASPLIRKSSAKPDVNAPENVATSPNTPNSLPFNIRAIGDYSPLYNFLLDLEQLKKPYKFNVKSFSIFKNEDDTESLSLEIKGEIINLPKSNE